MRHLKATFMNSSSSSWVMYDNKKGMYFPASIICLIPSFDADKPKKKSKITHHTQTMIHFQMSWDVIMIKIRFLKYQVVPFSKFNANISYIKQNILLFY